MPSPLKLNLTSKAALFGLLVLALFLGNLRYQQWKNQAAIDKEKRDLQEQINTISKKNQDLSDSLSYLGSPDFKDQVARQQLNLKRNGEVVFGFVDAPAAAPAPADPSQNLPDYQKWVEYFFGKD